MHTYIALICGPQSYADWQSLQVALSDCRAQPVPDHQYIPGPAWLIESRQPAAAIRRYLQRHASSRLRITVLKTALARAQILKGDTRWFALDRAS